MTTNNVTIDQIERLETSLNNNVLDTYPEIVFDNITQLVANICDSPIVFISLVGENGNWIKSSFGLEKSDFSPKMSFCNNSMVSIELYEEFDTFKSDTFKDDPIIIGSKTIRHFAGYPLTMPDGKYIGTLCELDTKPKNLNNDQKLGLVLLAKQVVAILETRNQCETTESKIKNESNESLNTELNSYKLALDETTGVVISETSGKIIYVNDEACRNSKYGREELLGKQSTIFDSGYHPQSFFDNLWDTISKGKIWKNEIKNLAKDGSIYWTDTTIIPFLDNKKQPQKYVTIKRDITRQKQESIGFEQFFNLSLDYFCVANTKGYFEKVSPVFMSELGFTEEELLSKSFFELIHEEDLEDTINEIQKLGKGVLTVNFKVRFKCKKGGYRLLSWNATPDKETGALYATARDITESNRIQEENKRLSLVAKGTNNLVVITDKKRKIEWVNQAFETQTGYKLDEVLGKSPGSFLQFEGTDPEKVNVIKEAMNSKNTFTGEIQNISKDGKKYWIEMNISPVLNENNELVNFIAIQSDITEKKNKDASIANLLETQISIFNGVGHAVMFSDSNGVIQRVNRALVHLIEYTEEDIVGKMNLIDFLDFDEVVERSIEISKELNVPIVPGFETLIARTQSKQKMDANEWTYISKSGKRIPVWLSVTCIKNSKGAILGYFSAAEDYTEKKEVEQNLIQAKNYAVQAAKAKDSFLANMSHEIRTPLNAIIGFTELLSQNQLDPTLSDYVKNINTAGANLLNIINDILDISKIESGQLVIESNPINIKSTLKHVYDLLNAKATEKRLEFNLFLDADMPAMVMGDQGRINQILMNLAGNSIKFTEQGEVSISVKKLTETNETVKLRFSIRDSGIGIPENKLDTIFERFTQAEATTTRRFGGTGLGLNIVKQLVELQNGEIFVKSKFGQGSEFQFVIEFLKVEMTTNDRMKGGISIEKENLGQLSILLCEDNELNQLLAKKVIEKFGFDLDIAENGKEGIDLLMTKEYDLILMDLQMAVMDGHQATVYIREVLNSNIPIIAMTAHSLVGERQKCEEIGMNGYVSKPFKQSELLEEIKSVIPKKEESNRKLDLKLAETESEHKSNLQVREIDFSYIDDLSNGDMDFRNEMITLFIDSIPEEANKLKNALNTHDTASVAKITHHMKSSLAMFKLEKEVEFLIETERNAIESIIRDETIHQFEEFQVGLNNVLTLLIAIKAH
ncbi:PAS domain S-box-containing protein [Spirosomataceae bacterium TFI 002]|nr:PAS domain S-box-containing protein [Spirosomataceae bacterium TFI 002]